MGLRKLTDKQRTFLEKVQFLDENPYYDFCSEYPTTTSHVLEAGEYDSIYRHNLNKLVIQYKEWKLKNTTN
jgi:hypothetical protein